MNKLSLQNYLKILEVQMSSPHTIRKYRMELSHFLNNVKTISDKSITEYIESLSGKLKRNSIKGRYIIIKKFLKFYNVSCPDIKIRKERIIPEFLTIEEAESIKSKIRDKRDLLIFCTLYETGMRLGELLNIKRSQLVSPQISIKGKGSRERAVFLSDQLYQQLRDYIDKTLANRYINPDDKIFLNRTGSALTPNGVNLILRKYSLPGKPLHAHMLRHSYASRLAQNGINLSLLQTLLGHSDPSTTSIYVHLTPSRSQIEKYWNGGIK